MILVIDNYDSFTYNLVQMLEALGETCHVVRNDAASTADLLGLEPTGVRTRRKLSSTRAPSGVRTDSG